MSRSRKESACAGLQARYWLHPGVVGRLIPAGTGRTMNRVRVIASDRDRELAAQQAEQVAAAAAAAEAAAAAAVEEEQAPQIA